MKILRSLAPLAILAAALLLTCEAPPMPPDPSDVPLTMTISPIATDSLRTGDTLTVRLALYPCWYIDTISLSTGAPCANAAILDTATHFENSRDTLELALALPCSGAVWIRVRVHMKTGPVYWDSVRVSVADSINVSVDTSHLTQPTRVRVTRPDSTRVRITWAPASKAVKYQVWSNPDRNAPGYSMSAEVTDTFAVHATRLDYWYYVVALDTAGNKAFSTDTVKRDLTAEDTTGPAIRLANPALAGSRISTSSKRIDAIIKDKNGISSVRFAIGNDTFPVTTVDDSIYYATATGLVDNTPASVSITAIDGATARNADTLTFTLTYAPAIDSNSPPSIGLFGPANGAQAIARGTVFRWSGTDDDGDSLTYGVYLGTLSDQLELVKTTADTFTTLTALLSSGVVYYWKVTVSDGKATTSSTTRSFKTNTIPTIALTAPSNGATAVALPVTFSWIGADADAGDNASLRYDLYISSVDSTPKVLFHDTSATALPVQGLSYGKSYKWKVVAKDGKDTTASGIQTFFTFVPTSRLVGLQVTGGDSIRPPFNGDSLRYSVGLSAAVSSISVRVVAEDSMSSIRIHGLAARSGATLQIPGIPFGTSVDTILVTGRDGRTTTTYLLSVNRPHSTFSKTIGGSGDDEANAVQQTSDGGYIIVGSTTTIGAGNSDVYIVKTDWRGDTLWTRAIGGAGDDIGYSVQQTMDRGYIVAGGWDQYGATASMYLIKLDSLGNVVLSRVLQQARTAYSVRQAADGGYIVAGTTSYNELTRTDACLLKTFTTMEPTWVKIFGGAVTDKAAAVRETSDNGYVLVGLTLSWSAGFADLWAVKTDRNGDTLWTRSVGGSMPDFGNAVIQSSSGDIICAGGTQSFSSNGVNDALVVKMTSTGATTWRRNYGGNDGDVAYSVVETNGGYAFAGETYVSAAQGYDAFLTKVTTNGDVVWSKTYGGGANAELARCVDTTRDGGYVLAGRKDVIGDGSNYDIFFVKTDQNGELTP